MGFLAWFGSLCHPLVKVYDKESLIHLDIFSPKVEYALGGDTQL